MGWTRPAIFAVCVGALATLAACATSRSAPYLLSPDGIGVAILTPPHADTAVVTSNWVDAEGSTIAGMRKTFGGPLGSLGLLLEPFALASDTAECDQKLRAAYPDLAEKASGIVEREFFAADVQDQFIAVLQRSTSIPITREEILFDNAAADGERQLLATASEHARGHLFVVEISNVSIQPFGKGCDAWKVWARMRIQLWRVADRKLLLSYSPGYPQPFVTGSLSEVKSVFDEPGVLRSRLIPTYEATANMFLYRALFQLPP